MGNREAAFHPVDDAGPGPASAGRADGMHAGRPPDAAGPAEHHLETRHWTQVPSHLGITVQHGDVPRNLPGAERIEDLYEFDGRRILTDLGGDIRVLVEPGGLVTIAWDEVGEPGRDPGWLIYGWAVRCAALLRGQLSLHAATVEINGQGVALAGPTGAGKSTTAVALGSRGHRLLADDVALLDIAEGEIRFTPCGNRVGLLPDAARALGVDAGDLVPLAGGRVKASLGIEAVPGVSQCLDLVLVLAPEDPEHLHATPTPGGRQGRSDPAAHRGQPDGLATVRWWEARGGERFRSLIAHTDMGTLARRVLGQVEYFTQLTRLASAVPVFVVERAPVGWTLDAVTGAVEEIVDHVRARDSRPATRGIR